MKMAIWVRGRARLRVRPTAIVQACTTGPWEVAGSAIYSKAAKRNLTHYQVGASKVRYKRDSIRLQPVTRMLEHLHSLYKMAHDYRRDRQTTRHPLSKAKQPTL